MTRKLASFLALPAVLLAAGCTTPAIDGNPPPYTAPGPTSTPTTTFHVGGGSNPGPAPTSCHGIGSGLYERPDPKCSPGAINPKVTQSNMDSTICKSGWTSTVRPSESVTEPEKLVEMKAYHATKPTHDYELDHIISLELGGATNSYLNYYPEPDYAKKQGFYLNPKDKLENKLNDMVCSGKMTLATARTLISTNWVAAYNKYEK